jgi:hypothetical protein
MDSLGGSCQNVNMIIHHDRREQLTLVRPTQLEDFEDNVTFRP